MIKVNNVSFGYEKENKNILTDVSFSVASGSWISVIGHNGCGKSTLAKIIMGLLSPTSGTVEIDDTVLTNKTVSQLRQKMGIIFQNPDDQFVGATVRYDLAFGMENLNLEREEIIKRINNISEEFHINDILDKTPLELSGGQKQKVALAGLLTLDKDIFIFDEALSMLDQKSSQQIFGLIKQLHKQGKTIITITHDLSRAFMADKVLLLKEGRVLFFDEPEKLYDRVNLLSSSNLDLPKPLQILKELYLCPINPQTLTRVKEVLWKFLLQK